MRPAGQRRGKMLVARIVQDALQQRRDVEHARGGGPIVKAMQCGDDALTKRLVFTALCVCERRFVKWRLLGGAANREQIGRGEAYHRAAQIRGERHILAPIDDQRQHGMNVLHFRAVEDGIAADRDRRDARIAKCRRQQWRIAASRTQQNRNIRQPQRTQHDLIRRATRRNLRAATE